MVKYTLLTDVTHTFPARNVPRLIYFVFGVLIGVTFALMFMQTRQMVTDEAHNLKPPDHFEHVIDTSDGGNEETLARHSVHTFENNSLAVKLHGTVRILCWIITTPSNLKSRAVHIKRTWGKRCNKLIFMSTSTDAQIDAIPLNVSHSSANTQWGETKLALKYIYDNHRDDADWFLKADDDSYIVMENLRYMLVGYATSDPIYFGCKMNRPDQMKQGYFAGNAGYVLSQNALHRFAMAAQQRVRGDNCNWFSDSGAGDVELGKCMEEVGVYAGDTRDELKRGRFFIDRPEDHLVTGDKKGTNWKLMWYRAQNGLDCCSDNAISFGHIRSETMYVFEYMLYHMRAYGSIAFAQPLPQKADFSEVTQQLTNERFDGASTNATAEK